MRNKLNSVTIPQMAGMQAETLRQIDELKVLATPLVEWVRENHGPHTEICISYDRVQVKHDGTGIPFPYSEK